MDHNSPKQIHWIFFDLDDTLWNFSANSAVSLNTLYEISPILRKLFKSPSEFIDIYHKHNFLLWDLYSQWKVTTRELKVERWRRTLATRQFEVLTAVCEELEKNYLDILAKGTEMIPGVTKMLQNLTKKYLIAVLSNGFARTQYKKLENSGLARYVTRTIVSDEIGVNKPSKTLFDYAIEETGAQRPYLMVGDHPVTDVLGALRAGWYAIWYNPQSKPLPYTEEELRSQGIDPSRLVAIVKDMDELERTIEDFMG